MFAALFASTDFWFAGNLGGMNTTSFIQSHAALSSLQSSLQSDTTGILRQKAEAALADFAAQLQALIEGGKNTTTSHDSATSGAVTQASAPLAASTPTVTQDASAETQKVVNGQALLLAKDADVEAARRDKPNMAAFMNATGVDARTASSTLYGVIGSHDDYRDWNAIMASENPLASARAATGAMYDSGLPYSAADSKALPASAIKAQALMATSNSPTFGQSNSPRQDV